MFSAWDFNSWFISIGVVLLVLSLLAGLSALMTALVCWIWGEERENAAIRCTSRTSKDCPIHKAA